MDLETAVKAAVWLAEPHHNVRNCPDPAFFLMVQAKPMDCGHSTI